MGSHLSLLPAGAWGAQPKVTYGTRQPILPDRQTVAGERARGAFAIHSERAATLARLRFLNYLREHRLQPVAAPPGTCGALAPT